MTYWLILMTTAYAHVFGSYPTEKACHDAAGRGGFEVHDGVLRDSKLTYTCLPQPSREQQTQGEPSGAGVPGVPGTVTPPVIPTPNKVQTVPIPAPEPPKQ